jgi:hypothetical protein
MSPRSPSNRAAALRLILACAIAPPCFADGVGSAQPADPLLRYKTIGGMQGMYEVRGAARQFLRRQPAPAQGEWTALLPDVRTFVPTCAVPLQTRWALASDHEQGMPGVMVICAKSTTETKWAAFVATGISPTGRAK